MIGILVDLLVVVFMKMALEKDESPNVRDLAIPVVVIAITNLGISLGLGASIGILVAVPMGIVAVAVLMGLCHMTLRNATITAVAMMAVRIGLFYLL